MRPVQSRVTKFIVMLAAVQILGGHWAVLQSVAWVGMVIKYAEHETLAGALEKTFDGAHPCSLCEVVNKGRGEEQKQQLTKLVVKLEAVLPAVAQLPLPPPRRQHFQAVPAAMADGFRFVLVEPPRAA